MLKQCLWVFVCVLVLCTTSQAEQCRHGQEPWVVYGATDTEPNTSLDDPIPNTNGLVGEVGSLPYTVPFMRRLVLTNIGLVGNRYPQAGIILWVGEGEATNAKTIPLTDSGLSLGHISGLNVVLPAGTLLHVRLQNSTTTNNTYAWYASGCMETTD